MNRVVDIQKSSRTRIRHCTFAPSHCRRARTSWLLSMFVVLCSHCSNWSSTSSTFWPSVTWPSRSCARTSASDASLARPGMCLRSALSSRSSVSLGVASTKMGSTCAARCGSRPAFTSDDLPQPEGPYITPTGNVASASVSSMRVFQNRIVSGSPSRSRGPGSSSRKKSLSSLSNDRSPLGTIRSGGCEPESGVGVGSCGVLSLAARTVAAAGRYGIGTWVGRTLVSAAIRPLAESLQVARNASRSSSRSVAVA